MRRPSTARVTPMPRIEFEIEEIVTRDDGVFVRARWMGPDIFATLHATTLGGAPIVEWCELPPAAGDDPVALGSYTFQLVHEDDRERFEPGARALLETA